MADLFDPIREHVRAAATQEFPDNFVLEEIFLRGGEAAIAALGETAYRERMQELQKRVKKLERLESEMVELRAHAKHLAKVNARLQKDYRDASGVRDALDSEILKLSTELRQLRYP
jgi:chromosome segregation ATPase